MQEKGYEVERTLAIIEEHEETSTGEIKNLLVKDKSYTI